ncbi:MAG: hypothetical protein Q619_VDC00589G0001, partial [Veillonella dispar DORA_11]
RIFQVRSKVSNVKIAADNGEL